MPALKYICLSDLHFGAAAALLTPSQDQTFEDHGDPLSDVLSKALVATLNVLNSTPDHPAQTTRKSCPDMILLGDIFDLSLGSPKTSIDSFDVFLKALSAAGGREALGSFVFLPGNHDHELWTVTRYQHMVQADDAENCFDHTTPAFADPANQPKAALIDDVLRRNGFGGATTFYPNMGLMSEDQKRAVVLHHGHFIEPMYRVMSSLNAVLAGQADIALDAESLERLNASWIDFIWSTDGDNGGLGAQIGLVHDALMTGGEEIKFDQRMAKVLSDKLIETLPIPRTKQAREWTKNAALAAVDSVLGQYGQMERFSYFEPLSAEAVTGLKTYLTQTVALQIADHVGKGSDPVDLTFIFGHTHKPFETRIVVDGFAQPPAVYNTGGWDMDTPMFGTSLGAAAVFIDDDLNVASLRLCNVPQQDGSSLQGEPEKPGVRVVTADGTTNPLSKALSDAIAHQADGVDLPALWKAFSVAAASTYAAKQKLIMGDLLAKDAANPPQV